MFKIFFDDRKYIKAMFAIAIPIALQSLIQSSLSMIDQFMVGQLGKDAIAAVGLGSRVPQILIVTIAGIASGAAIFTSQFWGNKDTKNIGKSIGASLLFSSIITLAFIIPSLIFSEGVLRFFTKDSLVVTQGAAYMRVIAYGYIPLMLVTTYAAVLRSTGKVVLPMYTGFISVGLNTLLNYILIFGKFGFPEMGVYGAAIATTTTRYIECFLIISISYIKKYPAAVPLKSMFNLTNSFMKKFCIIALPILINEFLWALGQAVYSAIYGQMGTEQIAAMTMTFPVQALTIGLFSGISSAAGVMIGNKLGGNDIDGAVDYSNKFIAVGLRGSVVVGIIIIVLSRVYVSAYNVSYEVQNYATKLLIVFGIVFCIKVCNMIIGSGILITGGKTKFVLMLDMIGTWGIGVPFGLLAAFLFKFSIEWVYLIISSEELVKLLLSLKIVYSKKWAHNIAVTSAE